MRTDDAVGMLTTRLLEADPRLPDGVTVIEGGTLGLDLLGRLDGISHLLVLDAVDCVAAPGTRRRFEGLELSRLPTSKSVHLLGLSDLLNVLLLMNAPAMEVVLLGVQPASTDWGTTLTPAVEAAQQGLAADALRQIDIWINEVRRSPRTQSAHSDAWQGETAPCA
jgi:hydrogenase maturation protease